MGLDMYLKAKTRLVVNDGKITGACGGLFPIGPKRQADTYEIGYWRKAYDVDEFIRNIIQPDDCDDINCVDMDVSENDCKTIIEEACRKVRDLNEEINDMKHNGVSDEAIANLRYKRDDWKDTINAFEKALIVLKTDPSAEIYYYIWY